LPYWFPVITKTILDAIHGRVLSIRDDVATIETNIGIVEATLPPTQTTIPLEKPIEWSLLLLAATVSITVITVMRLRKRKKTNHRKTEPPTPFWTIITT
jgi:hypothetical protein